MAFVQRTTPRELQQKQAAAAQASSERTTELERQLHLKDEQLIAWRQRSQAAETRVAELERGQQSSAKLQTDVKQLLKHQQDSAANCSDYENRVLGLELQGLTDRYHVLDVEELSGQNHELREEVLRLQQENMVLSRAVTDGSLVARRDVAHIEMALEETVRQKLRGAYSDIRQELYEGLDDKTKQMVAEHGALQDQLMAVSEQAAALDFQYGTMAKQHQLFKLDADVLSGMADMQARQNITLRSHPSAGLAGVAGVHSPPQAHSAMEVAPSGPHALRHLAESLSSLKMPTPLKAASDLCRRQLDHAALMLQAARAQVEAAELRAQCAAAQSVVRDARIAAITHAEDAEGISGRGEGDEDSALGLTGTPDSGELRELKRQVQHWRARQDRARAQRDRWRDRSILYEKACAQLQATLQTLQEECRLTLPSGAKQDLDSIWRQVRDLDQFHVPAITASSSSPCLLLKAPSDERKVVKKGQEGGPDGTHWPAAVDPSSTDARAVTCPTARVMLCEDAGAGNDSDEHTLNHKGALSRHYMQGASSLGFRPASGLQTSRLYSCSLSLSSADDASVCTCSPTGRPTPAAAQPRPGSALRCRQAGSALRYGYSTSQSGESTVAGRLTSAVSAYTGTNSDDHWQDWPSAGNRPASAVLPTTRSTSVEQEQQQQQQLCSVAAATTIISPGQLLPSRHPLSNPVSAAASCTAMASVLVSAATISASTPAGALQHSSPGQTSLVGSTSAALINRKLCPAIAAYARYQPGIMFSGRVGQAVQARRANDN